MLASSMLRQAAGMPLAPAFQAGPLTIMEVCSEVLGKPCSHQSQGEILSAQKSLGQGSRELRNASRSIFVWPLPVVTSLRPCVWHTSYGPHDEQLPF